MRVWGRVLGGAGVALLCLGAAPARARQAETPEAVAEKMVAAVRAGDWDGYVRLMHPDALASFKRMFAPLVRGAAGKEMGKMFFGAANAGAYDALAPAEVFKRFMAGLAAQSPEFKAALAGVEAQALGAVMEGGDTAHVVTRTKASVPGVVSLTKMEVVTVRRDGDTWRGLLSGEMEVLFQGILKAAEAQAAPRPAPKRPAPKKPAPRKRG